MRSLDTGTLSQWHSNVFGLTAIYSVCRGRVSKKLTLETSTGLSALTVIAFLACCVEWHDHLIADIEVGHALTFFCHGPHKFMTADEVRGTFEVATVEM
jgi:hypothetical protein